jgi:hypothetical protein
MMARDRFTDKAVLVTHRQSGRTARIKATPADALDVFYHPVAYYAADVDDVPAAA